MRGRRRLVDEIGFRFRRHGDGGDVGRDALLHLAACASAALRAASCSRSMPVLRGCPQEARTSAPGGLPVNGKPRPLGGQGSRSVIAPLEVAARLAPISWATPRPEPPMPLSLSDDEYAAVQAAAAPIHPQQRDAFLKALASELERHPVVGPGLVHRRPRMCSAAMSLRPSAEPPPRRANSWRVRYGAEERNDGPNGPSEGRSAQENGEPSGPNGPSAPAGREGDRFRPGESV